ncbi:hypothetical protein [Actinoallomurus soli]|uniref:hypothetical protein n=1 Tax=Actinoallomurus soli TaxID=2952535 RepID=UPI002093D9AE|nr:hypothetical protein [Actinoallomurus soli]MCO5970681.1 hypothetical protein [Actinoallomurus soli]
MTVKVKLRVAFLAFAALWALFVMSADLIFGNWAGAAILGLVAVIIGLITWTIIRDHTRTPKGEYPSSE